MLCMILTLAAHCQLAMGNGGEANALWTESTPVWSASENADAAPAPLLPIDTTSRMPAGDVTDSPRGFRELCERDPSGCNLANQGGDTKGLSPAHVMSLLRSVNQRINNRILWQADKGADRWERPQGNNPKGDCEDFALAKRDELIGAGFSADQMYLAIGYMAKAGLHAVLVVSTEQGDFVLDSLNERIVPWYKTPYIWVMRETSVASTEWRMVPDVQPRQSKA
jgi:predicted transglutaminase-like cysteine proteinase